MATGTAEETMMHYLHVYAHNFYLFLPLTIYAFCAAYLLVMGVLIARTIWRHYR